MLISSPFFSSLALVIHALDAMSGAAGQSGRGNDGMIDDDKRR